MDQLLYVYLSHTQYWYEVGMLKILLGIVQSRSVNQCRERAQNVLCLIIYNVQIDEKWDIGHQGIVIRKHDE